MLQMSQSRLVSIAASLHLGIRNSCKRFHRAAFDTVEEFWLSAKTFRPATKTRYADLLANGVGGT